MTREQALAIFGITTVVDEKQLRKVYRALSKKYHPDIAGASSEKMFLQIKMAYDVLTGVKHPSHAGGYTHDSIFSVRKEN